jgi:hypothetical protein
VRSVSEFLGVAIVLPPDLGERFHVGGSERRMPNVQRRLRRSPVGWIWKHVPQGTRSRLFIRFEHWNVRRNREGPGVADAPEAARWSAETERRLREHFARDEAQFAQRYGVDLPWR